ncbi:putative DNA repair protein Ntg1 [Talaromyces proteolyticus]|uniref:Endonuclease III homolog n=1 Tax=Talaromyces proteolyticus TaxID=1131652 RepID=A0AAD4KM91_9EURO|nr:putative DNA repair protein Ntg1 [Talaromyces proteolyticus]KAH8694897.1 putative DNA repair protein Ntg1 [Talaromyces proteolyticus]
MRTSRLSQDTAKVVNALASTRRQTRSSLTANTLSNFKCSETNTVKTSPSIVSPNVKGELSDDVSSLSSANTTDIEDLLVSPPKKRRRITETSTNISSETAKGAVSRRAKKEIVVKEEKESPNGKPSAPKQRRKPARKIKHLDGSVAVEPPSNWETMYEMVKKMRAENPTAPVDTMGCAELHWRASSPKDQRFQTLVALMLSSQTKDTVTAVAMQRLHTELGEGAKDVISSPKIKKEEDGDDMGVHEGKDSTLNLKNILAVSPERLNELIRTVGFHNNKTKYIKQTAVILRDQHDSDIPSTADELMKLPGVGPKMAYLCMSAAWGKHEGIGVDVHVHRITNMWGWHSTKNPEETRVALQSWLPKDKWHEINKLLVGLGQTACLPVARRCGECDLAGTGLCKSEIKGLVRKTKKEKIEEAEVKVEMP